MPAIERPSTSEYAPFYAGYLAQLTDEDPFAVLRAQPDALRQLLAALGSDRDDYRYADGKWSVKEVVGHIIDTERIFAYRALRIGRGDTTPLPGFDQDAYVAASDLSGRSTADLADVFARQRAATLDVFTPMDTPVLKRMGEASGVPVSVRALLYMIAGHTRHHLKILETRYF